MSTATFGNASHLLTLACQKGVTLEACDDLVQTGLQADLYEAATNGTLRSVNREDFRKLLGLGPLELRITVATGLSLEQMIAAGHYDWVNDNITSSRFPISGKGRNELVVEVIHFNRDISSENAVAELDKMGLRPATIEELLAFGATFPEVQRKFPVVALSSSCELRGSRYVPYLDRVGSERSLDLSWWGDDWLGDYRFLAVRKLSSGS